MSKTGKLIRGAGGLFKRNIGLGVDIGPPYGGEEGDIRVNMVNGQPRLYARAGNEWYNTPLYKKPLASILEENIGIGTKIRLDSNSTFSLESNRIDMTGGVGLYFNKPIDESIAIGPATGDKAVMGKISSTQLALGNIAIGSSALGKGTEMQYNVAIGYGCMENIGIHSDDVYTDCYQNVAIGYIALRGKDDSRPQAKENVAIGNASMMNANTTSDAANMTCLFNTCVGSLSGSVLEGRDNTFIGASAGRLTTSGSDNTCIGAGAAPSSVGASHQIVIGADATGVADNTIVLGNTSNVKTILAAGTLSMKAQADDAADITGSSQVWVKNTGDGILMFTDDDGTQYTVDVTAV